MTEVVTVPAATFPSLPAVAGPPPARDRFRGVRKAALYASPFLLSAAAVAAGFAVYPMLPKGPANPYGGSETMFAKAEPSPAAPDGAALFALHCSNCHGPQGKGDGPAVLSIRARHFGYDKFKFVSTAKAASTADPTPSDADLHALLQRGIDGSAMPAFPQLSEAEREVVIAHVRQLAWRGTYARLLKKAKADYDEGGPDVSPAQVAASADAATRMGPPLPFPELKYDSGSVARGRAIFKTAGCANCHGEDGSGAGKQVDDPKFDAARALGTLAAPRNFTLGRFKGGGGDRDLYARIHLGIAGPFEMPNVQAPYNTPQDTADLIAFIRSLAAPQPD